MFFRNYLGKLNWLGLRYILGSFIYNGISKYGIFYYLCIFVFLDMYFVYLIIVVVWWKKLEFMNFFIVFICSNVVFLIIYFVVNYYWNKNGDSCYDL